MSTHRNPLPLTGKIALLVGAGLVLFGCGLLLGVGGRGHAGAPAVPPLLLRPRRVGAEPPGTAGHRRRGRRPGDSGDVTTYLTSPPSPPHKCRFFSSRLLSGCNPYSLPSPPLIPPLRWPKAQGRGGGPRRGPRPEGPRPVGLARGEERGQGRGEGTRRHFCRQVTHFG